MKEGHILVHEKYNDLGRLEGREFEWVGGPIATLALDGYSNLYKREPNDVVRIGQYRAKIVGADYMQYHTRVVRMDDLRWRFVYFWHKITPKLRILKGRIILTLVIWRLATYHEGCIPLWRDIKLFKRRSQ